MNFAFPALFAFIAVLPGLILRQLNLDYVGLTPGKRSAA